MKIHLLLSQTLALLPLLAPVEANAASDTIFGEHPAWATATNWSLGALPTATDNAIITATGIVDINGSDFVGQITEVQDLTFSSDADTYLANNSTTADMILVLNRSRGEEGVGPLITTTGILQYAITGLGTGNHLLSLRLNRGGA